MIIDLIDKAVESGARLKKAAAIMGLSARTIIRWRHQDAGQDHRTGPSTAPANKLSEQERQQILAISNSVPFRDLSPKQIVPTLADQGIYLASESSFYRVLKELIIYRHFVRGKANIDIESGNITVTFPRKAHNPILRAVPWKSMPDLLSWMNGASLNLKFK